MDDLDYQVRAEGLVKRFDDCDIEAALLAEGVRPRAAGEPAMPELSTLIAKCSECKQARLEDQRKRKVEEERVAYNRRKAEHPEDFEDTPAMREVALRIDLNLAASKVRTIRPEPPPPDGPDV